MDSLLLKITPRSHSSYGGELYVDIIGFMHSTEIKNDPDACLSNTLSSV